MSEDDRERARTSYRHGHAKAIIVNRFNKFDDQQSTNRRSPDRATTSETGIKCMMFSAASFTFLLI